MTNQRDKMRQQRAKYEETIVRAIREHPERSYEEIGNAVGVTAGRIGQLAVKFNVRRRPARIKGEN